MQTILLLILILAPVPKESKGYAFPPDVKRAGNAEWKWWASDLSRFERLVVWIESEDGPRGGLLIDPETRDIVQTIYIRRVEKVDGQLVNVEIDKIENVKDPTHGGGK